MDSHQFCEHRSNGYLPDRVLSNVENDVARHRPFDDGNGSEKEEMM